MTATGEGDDQTAWLEGLLARHQPFAALGSAERAATAKAADVVTVADGEVVLKPPDGRVQQFWLVAEGRVAGERADTDEDFLLEPGEGFPMAALLGERATRTVYRAQGAARLVRLPAARMRELLATNAAFRDHCLRGVSGLLDRIHQATQGEAARTLGAESSFDTPLSRLAAPEPVACPAALPVSAAVQRMHERHVGSIVVVDDAQRPLGIFTLHDLRALVAGGGALGRSVGEVMSAPVRTLGIEESAVEAVLIMARHGIRHVVLVRGGALAGVVSERDLFALKRIDVVELMRTIDEADSVDTLVASRRGVQRLIDTLMAHGAAASHITRVLTVLNDHTVARAVDLCTAAAGGAPAPFTWIAFGSEGRCEQTLVTDQDNGMVFEAPDGQADALRQRLLPLARSVNEALARCGFTLCKGNIMASNPELCLTPGEWRQRFDRLIRSNTPENLLRSSIYFDFRAVHGSEQGVEELRARVLEQARSNSLFRRMMAGNALQSRPPLGLLRDFVTRRDDTGASTLDLKVRGLTPFVDAARLLSLEGGIAETNTERRLAAVGKAGMVDADAVGAWSSSFAFLQLRRLRLHQDQAHAGQPMSNHLDPEELNPMDRRVLKEAFRQARDLQKRLAVRYQL